MTKFIEEYTYDNYQLDVSISSEFQLNVDLNTYLIHLIWNNSDLEVIEIDGFDFFTKSEELHNLKEIHGNSEMDASYEIFSSVTSINDSENVICGLTCYKHDNLNYDKCTVDEMYFFLANVFQNNDIYTITNLHIHRVNEGGSGILLHWYDSLGIYFDDSGSNETVMGFKGHGNTVKCYLPYKSFFLEGMHKNISNLISQPTTQLGVLKFGISFYN